MLSALMPPAYSTLPLRGPAPWQQRTKVGDLVLVDAGEHVGEPGLGIDVVEARGLDQRVHEGGPLTAAVGACE